MRKLITILSSIFIALIIAELYLHFSTETHPVYSIMRGLLCRQWMPENTNATFLAETNPFAYSHLWIFISNYAHCGLYKSVI